MLRNTVKVRPGHELEYFDPRIHHCSLCAVRWRAVYNISRGQPQTNISEQDIRRYLKCWMDLWSWHDALTRWAIWALDVPNNPPDTFEVHVLVIELVVREHAHAPYCVFTGDALRIMHRDNMAAWFCERGMPEEELKWCQTEQWGRDNVQVCVVYRNIVIHHEGKYDASKGEPIGSGLPLRVVPQEQKGFYNVLAHTWHTFLMGALIDNDPTLTDQFIERMMYETADIFPIEVIVTPEQERLQEERLKRIAEAKKQRRKRKKESRKKRKTSRDATPVAEENGFSSGEGRNVDAETGDHQYTDWATYLPEVLRKPSEEALMPPTQDVSALLEQMRIDFSKIE